MAIGPNFESVLQAARVGADWAWSAIYRDLSPSVLRYLRARGAKDPEDVLGEVFVSMVRSLGTFAGGESDFRAWVFRCARNAAIDANRRDSRRPLDYVADDELHDRPGGASAEEHLLRTLAVERVLTLLAAVSEQQREVIRLRVLVGLTIEETAQVLGRSCGSVKSLQVRGFAALRREIARGAVSK